MQVAGKDEGEGSRDAVAGKDEEEDEQVWCERRKGSAQGGAHMQVGDPVHLKGRRGKREASLASEQVDSDREINLLKVCTALINCGERK